MTKTKGKVNLTNNQRFAIARGREQGRTLRQLAEQFKVDRSTFGKFLKRWRAQNGKPGKRRHSRASVTNHQTGRNIVRASRSNPRLSVPEVLDQVSPRGSPVASGRTIRQRLIDAGMFGRRPVKKPYISDRNRAARVAWARAHLNWTQSQWERVLWSDESKSMLFGLDGISYAKRPVGTRFNPKYQTPTVKHSGGNVMVWSCFSCYGVGPLHRIRGNMNRFVYEHILQNVMLPFALASPRLRYSFQQDYDPKHTSNHIIESEMSQTITIFFF
uniref:HTH_Tnp_Tc3_2 domain-containing protein n=1 Tax=Caenorhabditis japonica TaxID=281687 RepID=A0A8R1HZ05_CAEJA